MKRELYEIKKAMHVHVYIVFAGIFLRVVNFDKARVIYNDNKILHCNTQINQAV